MPVFFFTIHAYRSWRPDNPKGYVRRGEGVLPPDRSIAQSYDNNATDPPASFSPKSQQTIARIVADACERRSWRLHALAVEPSHAHLLISWEEDFRSSAVCGKLKNLISRELNLGQEAKRKWLSRGASRRRVSDRAHFDHLVEVYLPKHQGVFWAEGLPKPWGEGPSAPADGLNPGGG